MSATCHPHGLVAKLFELLFVLPFLYGKELYFLWWGLAFFMLADWLLLCCQIVNIHTLLLSDLSILFRLI